MQKHQNNFDLLRLLAALGVVFTHSFEIHTAQKDTLSQIIPYSASTISLIIFFTISGFLVTKSLLNTSSLGYFFLKRLLRILPALAFTVGISLFAIGPLLTTVPLKSYFTDPLFWLYFQVMLGFKTIQPLPGIGFINGSLWSIALEMKLYLLLGGLSVIGRKHKRWLFGGCAILLLIAQLVYSDAEHSNVAYIKPLYFKYGEVFMIGSIFALFPNILTFYKKYTLTLVLFLFILSCIFGIFHTLTLCLAMPYLTIQIGLSRSRLGDFIRKLGDFSYGIYVYAYPIQLLVIDYLGRNTAPPLVVFAITLVFLLPLSVFSWFYIEKPCIALKPK